MKILGIGHYSRTGKDTFANHLVASLQMQQPSLRVKRESFARKMKQIAFELFHWAGVMPPEFYETAEGEIARNVRLPLLASDIFPEGPTPVELWINIGTDAFRNNVYPDTWIDYLLRGTQDCDLLIVTDTRFLNEARKIKQLGGTLLRMLRLGVGPRESKADYELLLWRGWDYTLPCPSTQAIHTWAKWFAQSYAYDMELPVVGDEVKVAAQHYLDMAPVKYSLIKQYSVAPDAA